MVETENRIIKRRVVRSYMSTMLCISLVLFLLGVAALLAVNAVELSAYMKERIEMDILLTDQTTDMQADTLLEQVLSKPYTKEAKVISREEAKAEMAQLLGADFLDIFSTNPLPLSISIRLKAPWFSKDSINMVQSQLTEMPYVREISFHRAEVERLITNIKKAVMFTAIFVSILLCICVVLISSTIRLTVYLKRFSIYTMRLVGATRSFICRPFVAKSALQGLISSLVAVVSLLVVLLYIRQSFPAFFVNIPPLHFLFLLLGIIAVGVLLCIITTRIVVGKIIRTDKDHLYY